MTTGATYVNAQLKKSGTGWRLVSCDHASACFQKYENPRVVWLPFDLLLSCKSVVDELDEVLALVVMTTPH